VGAGQAGQNWYHCIDRHNSHPLNYGLLLCWMMCVALHSLRHGGGVAVHENPVTVSPSGGKADMVAMDMLT